MNSKTIIASLGLLGLACTAQAALVTLGSITESEGIIVPHILHGMIPILE